MRSSKSKHIILRYRFLKSTFRTSIQDKTKVPRKKKLKERLNSGGKRPRLEEGGKEIEIYMEGS